MISDAGRQDPPRGYPDNAKHPPQQAFPFSHSPVCQQHFSFASISASDSHPEGGRCHANRLRLPAVPAGNHSAGAGIGAKRRRETGHGTRDTGKSSAAIARTDDAGSETVTIDLEDIRIFRLYLDDGQTALRAAFSPYPAAAAYEADHPGVWVIRAIDETWGH